MQKTKTNLGVMSGFFCFLKTEKMETGIPLLFIEQYSI